MSKYIVTFKLLDGRGDSEQHFDNKEDADEFLSWCKRNPELVSNPNIQEDIDE